MVNPTNTKTGFDLDQTMRNQSAAHAMVKISNSNASQGKLDRTFPNVGKQTCASPTALIN